MRSVWNQLAIALGEVVEMESLMAGVVAGYAISLLFIALLVPRLLAWSDQVQAWYRRFPQGTPLPMLAVGVMLFVQSSWAVVGMLFGGFYWSVREDAANGLGSPAGGYSLAVTLLAALALAAWSLVLPAAWGRAAIFTLAFAATFGWFLPHLAEA